MKVFEKLLTTSLLISCFAFIVLFLCGCEEPYTQGKKQYDYIPSQQDVEFQKGSDRPPTVKTLYSLAKILIHQGQYDDAELLLQRVTEKTPGFMPAYNDLAEIKIRKRHTNEAIDILSRAVKENSSDPVTLNNLGMCWMIRKNYEEALKMFTEAAGLAPENTRYRANMAVVLGLMGRNDEALALYRQILPEEQADKNLAIIQQARNTVLRNSN